MTTSALGDARRAGLARAKVRALARSRLGAREWEEDDLGGLAAVHDGTDGVVLIEGQGRGLALAVVWADRLGLDGDLHVIAEEDAGIAARHAALVARPIIVWAASGATLDRAAPASHLPLLAPPEDALAAAEPLRLLGAELVVEHGVVMAEILGLEVGRVVPDESTPTGWALEVGVGKNDRAASVIMGAMRAPEEAVRNVVDVVRTYRRADASPHLLNRLARPRWLRAAVIDAPGDVGANHLAPIEAPLPRSSLVDPSPALALGETTAGSPLLVACSVGVDLEAVLIAADARDRLSHPAAGDPAGPGVLDVRPAADATAGADDPALAADGPRPDIEPQAEVEVEAAVEVVIVTPSRDQYPPLRRLAELLVEPARLVAVDGDWPQ